MVTRKIGLLGPYFVRCYPKELKNLLDEYWLPSFCSPGDLQLAKRKLQKAEEFGYLIFRDNALMRARFQASNRILVL